MMETECLACLNWEQWPSSTILERPVSLQNHSKSGAVNKAISIREESIYVSDDANTIAADIRKRLIQTFPRSSRLVEDPLCGVCSASFQLDWSPLVFAHAQPHVDLGNNLEAAITFTGWSRNVQSTTPLQYMRQVWPVTGIRTLQFLAELLQLSDDNSHTWNFPGDISFSAKVSTGHLDIIAHGPVYLIAELGEQLAWLCAALRPSPGSGVVYCKPFLSFACPQQMNFPKEQHQGVQPDCVFRIGFEFETNRDDSESNGCCWQHLFKDVVVVKGYPILRRPASDTGLEIPLKMVGGAKRHEGITWFSSLPLNWALDMILVPTGYSGGVVFWHAISSKMWKHVKMSQHCMRTAFARNSRVRKSQPCDLSALRHVVGWTANAKSFIGRPDANYHIRWSKLPSPHAGLALEKVSISAGQVVTGGASFAIGARSPPIHISRNSYSQRLRWLSSKYVILYDVDGRRGWLADGVSTLLHLVRASLYYKREHEDFKASLLFEPGGVQEAVITDNSKLAAIEVLLNPSNLDLPVYPLRNRIEVRSSDTGKVVSIEKDSYYTFRDLVSGMISRLEKLFAVQEDVQSKDGVGFKIKFTPRRMLEGYDFMDIATDRDTIYPRMEKLRVTGQGWVDFARGIQAITLFGRGYGDLIVSRSSHYSTVPEGRDYLAVLTADLQDILNLKGGGVRKPWQLTEGLYWHAPEEPFQPRSTDDSTETQVPVQVILPAKVFMLSNKSLKSPSHLEPDGVVIFGHNPRFPLLWKDPGNVEEGEVVEPEEVTYVSHSADSDSGVGQSISSSSRPGSPFKPHLAKVVELSTDPAFGSLLEDSNDNLTASSSAPADSSRTWQYEVRQGLGRLIQQTFFSSSHVLQAAFKFPIEHVDDGLLVEERICRLLDELVEGIRLKSDVASEVRLARILEVFKQHIAHLIAKAGGWSLEFFPISFITSLPEETQEILIGIEYPEATETFSNVLLPHPAYARFLQQLNDLAFPTFLSEASRLLKLHGAMGASKLKDLVSELHHARGPIRDFRVADFEDTTRLDRIKTMVEDASGASWDWWPLQPPKYPLKYGEARVQWKCSCGSERWVNVPRWFGHGIADILHQSGLADQSPQSGQSGSGGPGGSSSTNASGTGAEQIPMVNLGAHNDNGPDNNGALANESLAVSVDAEKERWIFLLVKTRWYELAQGDARGMTSTSFWRFLQEEYRRLRGWRRFFSVYVFHYCDFVSIERFRPSMFNPGDKFEFPPLNHTEYTYDPKPISPEPPISKHEFEENFSGCYEDTCMWHDAPFRWLLLDARLCNTIRDIPSDKILKIPKRDRRVATLSSGYSEVFWGMVARERRSFFRVCIWVMVLLLPTLLFGSGWLGGWFGTHAGEVSNAAVPFTLLLAVLSFLLAASK